MYNAFEEYTHAIEDCVKKGLPRLEKDGEAVVKEADDVRKHAESQFEKLDILKKGKAVLALGYNLKMLLKGPKFIKESSLAF